MQEQNESLMQYMASAEPGVAAYGRISENGQNWETGILIREDDRFIRRLERHPVLAVRAGLLYEGDIPLVVVMVQHTRPATLYESWLNYHQVGGSMDYIGDWLHQERLPVIFIGDNLKRAVALRNPLKDFFRQAMPFLRNARAWTMEEFDTARQELYEKYSVENLWDMLGESLT